MAGTEDTGGLKKYLEDLGKSFGDAIKTNVDIDSIKKKFVEVEDSAISISRSFGVGRDNITNIKAAMTDLVGKAKLLNMSFYDVAEIQQSIAEDLGRNVLLTEKSADGVLATAKVLKGMGMEFGATASKFKDVGVSYMGVSKQMEGVVNTARKLGVNAKGVVGDVVKNLDKLNKYNFKGGVDGLAKMAAQSKVLRVNMDEIFEVADKAFNPEGAIDMAAAMQRLGVTQSDLLDPLRLMDLASNDPGELMNQIGKMSEKFVQLNKDGRFEIMPGGKRQLMEISKELGISYKELTKMAVGSKELDMKMSKIKFPSTFTEEQRNLIANMAEIGPGGEMTMRIDGKEFGIDEAMAKLGKDDDAMKKFMADSEPKTMEELAKEQLSFTEQNNIVLEQIRDRVGYGLASSKGFETLTKAQMEIQQAAIDATQSKTLSEKGIRETIGYQSDELMKALADRDVSKVAKVGYDFGETIVKAATELTESASKAGTKLKESDNTAIRMVTGKEEGKTKTITEAKPVVGEAKVVETKPGEYNFSQLAQTMEQLRKQETTQNLNYNGNLTVSVNTPPGVDKSQFERYLNDLLKDPSFVQRLAKLVNDPTASKNPLETNQEFRTK